MIEPAAVRLLLVEDDPADAELTQRVLREGGLDFSCERVETEAALRAALARSTPDAVITDYSLPGLDAPRVVAVVREVAPATPVLCVSGSIGEDKAVELLKLGAVDYVMKDRPARLSSSLRRALDEARTRAAMSAAEAELKASRERLAQTEKLDAIGRLAGGVAHDFNNILTTIAGCCELLLSGLPESSPHREEVREISSAAERATRLTRQLLAFGRRQTLEPRVLDLNAVVRGFDGMLRRLLGPGVELSIELDPACRRVRADATQLEQILLNLAVNARDALSGRGRTSITTRMDGQAVALAFSDDGPGMPPEVAARAYEPFFTTKPKGTGLGLPTVFGIVHQMGGSIELDTAPGRGTSFTLRFPSTDQPSEERKTPAPSCGAARGESVLLVDDDAAILGVTRRVLESRGYRVTAFTDSRAAEAAVQDGLAPDAAVLDAILEGDDGPSLLRRLRRARPGLKAMFISGYADPGLLPDPVSGRPYPFIHKPFTAAALLAKLRETLDQPS